jgi:hypothetical protein
VIGAELPAFGCREGLRYCHRGEEMVVNVDVDSIGIDIGIGLGKVTTRWWTRTRMPSILSHKTRRAFSNGLQLLTRHAFIVEYSDRFCLNAGDNTCCPCNNNSQPPTPLFTPPSTPMIKCTTLHHLLFECHLHTEVRDCLIGTSPYSYLFSTEMGGKLLTEYTFLTQTTLCPLPPRPDPP